eukprot:COSAG04_NODE_30550_length_262_cov_0.625767_1_plen_33_part_10
MTAGNADPLADAAADMVTIGAAVVEAALAHPRG